MRQKIISNNSGRTQDESFFDLAIISLKLVKKNWWISDYLKIEISIQYRRIQFSIPETCGKHVFEKFFESIFQTCTSLKLCISNNLFRTSQYVLMQFSKLEMYGK